MKKVFIITAILQELEPILDFLSIDKIKDKNELENNYFYYKKEMKNLELFFFNIGVGYFLAEKNFSFFYNKIKPDLVILFGFAGAIKANKLDELYYCNKLYKLEFNGGNSFKNIVDKEFNKLHYKMNKKIFKIDLSKEIFAKGDFNIVKKTTFTIKKKIEEFLLLNNISFANSLTSEIPILDNSIKESILNREDITLVEMENYIVYNILKKDKIKFFPFRIISDFADNNLKKDFENTCLNKLKNQKEKIIKIFDNIELFL